MFFGNNFLNIDSFFTFIFLEGKLVYDLIAQGGEWL